MRRGKIKRDKSIADSDPGYKKFPYNASDLQISYC